MQTLASPDDFERPLDTELLEAVLAGDAAAIEAAIARSPRELAVRSHAHGCNALELSLDLGRLEITELLLSSGADPNDGTSDFSALSSALSLPDALRAPAVALLARHGVTVRELDRRTASEVDADPSLLQGLPASDGTLDRVDDEVDPLQEAGAMRPRSDRMHPPAPAPSGPPVSDAGLTVWMFGWAMALLVALVAVVALMEWAGWI